MRFRATVLMLGLSGLAGCAAIKDGVDECVITLRNCRCSNRAWRDHRHCYPEMPHPNDFRKGFKDGYRAVANGKSRCQPALPPECYWRFCHESADGQAEMIAWFNGYSEGAAVAEQHGIAEASRIVIAPTIPPPSRRRRPAGLSVAPVDPAADSGPKAGPGTFRLPERPAPAAVGPEVETEVDNPRHSVPEEQAEFPRLPVVPGQATVPMTR